MRSTTEQIRAMRLGALAIDAGGAASLGVLAGHGLGWFAPLGGPLGPLLVRSVWILVWIGLLAAMLLRDALPGGSPGKQLLGLRLKPDDPAGVTPRVSILRNLPLVIPFMVFWEARRTRIDPEGRRMGDLWGGTRVEET